MPGPSPTPVPATQLAASHEGAWVACPQCDLLHQLSAVPAGARVHCQRCYAPLQHPQQVALSPMLALCLAALLLLLIAHLNPVVGITLQGQLQEASLWRAALELYQHGAWFLSLVVLATTLLFPLIELVALCYVLAALRDGVLPRGFVPIVRNLHTLKPWVMVEVFMLGVLIAVVKLAALATIIVGVGIWAFAAVMLLMAWISAQLDTEALWDVAAKLKRGVGST